MNEIIKSKKIYKKNHGWLKTTHLFSFADYYDLDNMSFWNLRVFNDDYIDSNTWFWLHPHSNMEILTILLDWEITHWDSMWNKQVTKVWEVQTMTAWTWVFHSEQNFWEKQTHLYQIWFMPNKQWLEPDYKNYEIDLVENKLNLLASWSKEDNVWFLNTSIWVYRWIFKKDEDIEYEIKENRGMFLYLKSGKIKIWDDIIETEDQLRFSYLWNYKIEFLEDSDFILIDVSL